jgi:hypothetical protein
VRNKIFGAIGVLWGGGILFRWFTQGPSTSMPSAYQSGEHAAMLFGLVMLVVGFYYLFKKSA